MESQGPQSLVSRSPLVPMERLSVMSVGLGSGPKREICGLLSVRKEDLVA